MARTPKPQCAWCEKESITTTNVGKGRKLQLVPVCQEHESMIARERDRLAEMAAQKKKGLVVHW